MELLLAFFPYDGALKIVKLGKQKATNSIRQVLRFDYLQQAVSTLRLQKFSIIIDEKMSLSTSKQLAILETYFDLNSFKSKYDLLAMVEVEVGRHHTRELLFNKKDVF